VRFLDSFAAFGTTGVGAKIYVPGGGIYGMLTSSNATGTITYGATFDPVSGNTFVNSNAKELRVVSFGCIIRSQMTATTAKGTVIVATEPNPLVNGTTPIGSLTSPTTVAAALAPGLELTWVSKPLGPSAHLFRQVGSYANTMTDFDWTSCSVQVINGDATTGITYLSVEYVLNLEMTVQNTGTVGLAQLQKPAVVTSPHVMAAASKLQAASADIITGGVQEVGKFVEQQAGDALQSLMGSLAGLLL